MTTRLTPEQARAEMARHAGQQPETAVRKQIVQYLRTLGWDVTYHMAGPLSRKGFPDLTALRGGHTVYIEVKAGKGKLTDHQRHVQAEIESHGGDYIVAYGIDDVLRLGRTNGTT